MSEFKKFDKQIYFIKIIMVEGCPLRCSYCFVDKNLGRVIEESNLMKLIDLLLYSPGQNKLLHLLGGEPLLCFDLIKTAVTYARSLEKKLSKDLDISFCTSGLYFDEKKLKFIRDNKIYLAWSIDGPKEIHDRNRVLGNGKGSYDKIIEKKDLVQKYIDPRYLGIAMTIDTNTVDELYESYKYLVDEEKFKCTINIAPVDGKIWPKEKQKKFVSELQKVHEYIYDAISRGRYLYLNSINKEHRFNMLSVFRKKGGRCLWFYTEALTNGDVLFNPFVNTDQDYSHYVVANIGDTDFLEKVNKYIGCKFHAESQQCFECKRSYFEDSKKTLHTVQMNKLLNFRDRVSVAYSYKIQLAKKDNIHYRNYYILSKDYMYV